MHIFGKVMLWLVMLGWFPALYFAVQMLHIQNSWSEALHKQKEAGKGKAETLIGKQRELTELQEEYNRQLLGWGQTFSPVPIMGTSPNGELTLRLGTNNGLIAEKDSNGGDVWPMVYGFQIDQATNTTRYIGEFQVLPNELREDQCRVRPTWRPLQNPPWRLPNGFSEVQTWNTATPWRFRTAVAGDAKLRYDNFKDSFTSYQVHIDSAQRNLANEDERLVEVTAQLQAGETKLLGPNGGALGGDASAVDPRFPLGLQPTIDEIEEEQNDAQFKLDRLHRLIKAGQDEVETLKQDINQLYRQLPT